MIETIKLSLALACICAVAAGVLAFAEAETRDRRKKVELRERQKALRMVLSDFSNNPLEEAFPVQGSNVVFYPARGPDGSLVGIAGRGVSVGFGGRLHVLLQLGCDGSLGTVMVTAHKETPGLGTQATDRKMVKSIWDFLRPGACPGSSRQTDQQLPPSDYLDQYAKDCFASKAPFRVTQDGGSIEAVSGATVSSRAVAAAVSRVCQAFEKNKDGLLTKK